MFDERGNKRWWLDVFENEPNVPEELFALDNVVLSPHAAAYTLDCFMDACEHVAKSLDAFFSSLSWFNAVNWSTLFDHGD
ncbi:hypothetical protein HN51_053766 [Arachis hypogaea]